MVVVNVSQLHRSRRDTDSCALAHVQMNVSTVTARVHTRPKLASTCKISSKTVTFSITGSGTVVNFREDALVTALDSILDNPQSWDNATLLIS